MGAVPARLDWTAPISPTGARRDTVAEGKKSIPSAEGRARPNRARASGRRSSIYVELATLQHSATEWTRGRPRSTAVRGRRYPTLPHFSDQTPAAYPAFPIAMLPNTPRSLAARALPRIHRAAKGKSPAAVLAQHSRSNALSTTSRAAGALVSVSQSVASRTQTRGLATAAGGTWSSRVMRVLVAGCERGTG